MQFDFPWKHLSLVAFAVGTVACGDDDASGLVMDASAVTTADAGTTPADSAPSADAHPEEDAPARDDAAVDPDASIEDLPMIGDVSLILVSNEGNISGFGAYADFYRGREPYPADDTPLDSCVVFSADVDGPEPDEEEPDEGAPPVSLDVGVQLELRVDGVEGEEGRLVLTRENSTDELGRPSYYYEPMNMAALQFAVGNTLSMYVPGTDTVPETLFEGPLRVLAPNAPSLEVEGPIARGAPLGVRWTPSDGVETVWLSVQEDTGAYSCDCSVANDGAFAIPADCVDAVQGDALTLVSDLQHTESRRFLEGQVRFSSSNLEALTLIRVLEE